jgi:hypothetical protein
MVWATIVVARDDAPAPADAFETQAVVDGWRSWLLPALRPADLLRAFSGWQYYPVFAFVVVGDGDGSFWTRTESSDPAHDRQD